MLNVLADENMPFVDELFSGLANVKKMGGRDMRAEDLIDVDVLLVRSITKVNEQLLNRANRLRFVGTATIGVDHIDQDYLAERSIPWSSAPGCNATAVAEYVISALLALVPGNLQGKTVAIVGAGNIGTRLAVKLEALGVNYFYCDPPKQRAGSEGDYRDLDAVTQADIISLHVPIIRKGIDCTEHMVNAEFLNRLKPGAVLINSCRGDVVDNQALREHLLTKPPLYTVMDVWQNEPMIDLELLKLVDIATPHIAGYSLEGKANGTFALYQKWCELSGEPAAVRVEDLLPKMAIDKVSINQGATEAVITKLVHLIYDIRDDDLLCRRQGIDAKGFDNLRKQYKVRREFSALSLDNTDNPMLLKQLGFSL